jgi:coiled-coil domain-containing protein 12
VAIFESSGRKEACGFNMASTHASLDAAATERKARLAKLKSLKRKQPDSESTDAEVPAQDDAPTVTTAYLSGRNYDPSTRGPKLGFENAPSENQETLEIRAKEISDTTQKQAEAEEKADKPIDLFKLQPKKPNWDLKRDLQRKLERLNVQTDNMIAKLVRERIEAQKKLQQVANGSSNGEGDAVGLQGEELVEGVHVREREDAEEERREREEEDEYE